VEAALGFAPSFNHEFKFGGRYTVGDFSFSSLPKFGSQKFNRRGLFARYRYDTFDDMSFPAEGNLAHFELLASEDNIQEDQKETYTRRPGQ
jgi:NTE family protein